MNRTFVSFPITDFIFIKRQILTWAARFNICCFLDNQQYDLTPHSAECLLGAGAAGYIQAGAGNAFDKLEDFAASNRDWLFGHVGYGLAAETEPAHARSAVSTADPSGKPGHASSPGPDHTPGQASPAAPPLPDPVGFPDLYFFVPEIVIELEKTSIRIGSGGNDHAAVLAQILQAKDQDAATAGAAIPHAAIPDTATPGAAIPDTKATQKLAPMVARFSREEYLGTVQALREHILRGDCYEINFCQEFFSCPAYIDPLQTWYSLSAASPNPFSAFYRLDGRYLLCASPERYLKRTGNTLVSQPIKGTSARRQGDPAMDEAGRQELYNSAKDRSENVMIVDLVRNDLSKICLTDTVRVEELYGVYSFPRVHQMISTIRGELAPGTGFTDVMRATFPMGSMTGAPKNRVVALIGQYERSRRGIFSGAVGYITPEGDFDFNVVIRSILYNRENAYLSYQVGSGITWYSDPLLEYEECLVKAEGIKKALGMD